MLASTRRGIIYPNTNRADTADIPRDIAALVAALEVDLVYGQGTLTARPTSTPGTPGLEGRLYVATDLTPHVAYYDYGTGWDALNGIAAGGVRGSDAADVQREILQGSIRRVDLHAHLKPSGTAAAGDEALRALGTTAGTAAAGNDTRLTDTRTPLAGHDPASSGTSFPTVGLFNGYRFVLLVSGVIAGGYVAQDHIYRADLDGTYPWHFCGGGPQANSGSGTFNDGAYNFYDLTGGFSVPRSGIYEGFGYAYGSAGGGGGLTSRFIMGATTFGATGGGNQSHNGFAALVPGPLAAGNVIKMQGQSSDGFAAGYTGYFGCRPVRLI